MQNTQHLASQKLVMLSRHLWRSQDSPTSITSFQTQTYLQCIEVRWWIHWSKSSLVTTGALFVLVVEKSWGLSVVVPPAFGSEDDVARWLPDASNGVVPADGKESAMVLLSCFICF